MPTDYFKEIYEHIQDGIIVMTTAREIRLINPAGKRLTGWQVGDTVPFCSYCMSCVKVGEVPSCYLIENKEVPSFLSEMPTYHGKKIDVEMSTAAIYVNEETGDQEYLLVLRDQELFKRAAQAATSKKMLRDLVEAKESEHKRLAQELHDGVGQSLFSISIALQAIDTFITDNEELSAYVGEVREELAKVMEDVSNYSHQLRPHIIDQLGLEAAIASLVEVVQKNLPNSDVQFEAVNMVRKDPAVEINIYRVVQEALHNVTKYAEATKVRVLIEQLEDRLHVSISDNGRGFERESLPNEGLGLLHMEERVEQIGGICSIQSEVDSGTLVEISVPNWEE